MPWIARTDGATSGEATELREGELTDIAAANRGNWREVDGTRPSIDSLTQQFVRTGLPIAGDGAVSVAWQIFDEPGAVVKLRLSQLASQIAIARLASGRIERNGKQIGIDDATLSALQNGKAAIDAGVVSQVGIVTADGEIVNVGATPLNQALVAIVTAREAIFTARKTIADEVAAGTVTTSDGVRTHAAWP